MKFISSTSETTAAILVLCGVVGVSAMLPRDFNLSRQLPASWMSICQVLDDRSDDVNATITCHVTPGDDVEWRLADLRSSLAPIVDSGPYEVALEIDCEAGGNISLPFPMRSPGLVKLKVSNCRLLDKFADFNSSALELGDWLRELDMRSCTWVNEPGSLDVMVANLHKLTSHYECGQDSTLVSYIYRNISDELSLDQLLGDDSALGDVGGLLGNSSDLGGLLGNSSVLAGLLGNSTDLGNLLNSTDVDGLGNLLGSSGSDGTGSTGHSVKTSADTTPSSMTPQDPAADVLGTITNLDNVLGSCNFERLEVMDESFNPLTSKHHFEFMVKDAKFPRLLLLNYTMIGMTDVPRELREWRRFFPALRTLDLSHNYIQELGNIIPYPYVIPTTFVLQHNNISRITLQMFKDWARVENFYVDISYNPLDCNCEEFGQFSAGFPGREKVGGAGMTCATPTILAGRAIGSLTHDDLPCPVAVADLRAAMAVLSVVAVVLLVLLIVAVRYRREVRILMFTRVHVLLPCGLPHAHSGGDVPEKKFDAFVAYAHQDSDWVLGQLLTKLEEPTTRACGPCKLCIHQRDFVVGKPIIDNIIDSIAASRHTIVIVSSSFVKSAWAMEELQQAYRQSLEERRAPPGVGGVGGRAAVRHDARAASLLQDLHLPARERQAVLGQLSWNLLEREPPRDSTEVLRFLLGLLYSIHVTAENAGSKSKEIGKESSDNDYDNVAFGSKDAPPIKDVESGLPSQPQPVDMEFQKALFLETMRTISVDSTCSAISTVSDDRYLVASA
ncbi:hypothetical protein BaRGS_00003411 [Batillaria attramentaria]|uniref:TIR domain-containing protein n=1 Tax=Batillaria attramentaria TaxID=370345 RepID=A0ABD0LZY6_9CAEN